MPLPGGPQRIIEENKDYTEFEIETRGVSMRIDDIPWIFTYLVRPCCISFPDYFGYFVPLDKNFKEGEVVTPSSLLEKGLVAKIKGKRPKIKILAKGKLTKKLEFKNCSFSKKAQEEISKL